MIFICLEDPFPPYGRAAYRFRQLCVEDPTIEMQDGTEKIFLNASGDMTGLPAEMQDFLRYLLTKKPSSALTEGLDAAVQTARLNGDWRHMYMTLQMKLNDAKDEGIEIGLTEGHQEEKEDSVRRMLRAGKLPDDEIAAYADLPIARIQELRAELRPDA